MASSNVQRLKSVVVKPPVHPLSRPSHRQQASHDQASQRHQASHAQTSRSASPPSETISFGDLVNPDWPKEKRLVYNLQYFGHFNVDSEHEWTQEEVDAEWARQQAINTMGRPAVTERSPAFILNPNFKPPSPPQVESDDEDYKLPFEYKPHPTLSIDWDAVRAQPYQRTEDSAAYKAAVLNSKKRKSEEDLEEDVDAIK